MYNTDREKIFYLMEELKLLTIEEFIKLTKLKYEDIKDVIENNSRFTIEIERKIIKRLKINTNWWIFQEGKVFKKK